MNSPETASEQNQTRKLADAVRAVKNAQADRDDVVVELRESQKIRLELLAAELEPVFADVPADVDLFDFAISSGLQPRLWIDAVSHVAMGRDTRTYRFLQDGRAGRVVLAESPNIKPVADQVTRYIAERLVERERLQAGETLPLTNRQPVQEIAAASERQKPASKLNGFFAGLGVITAGALAGLAIAALLLWERLSMIRISF
jgi:hypothetical protein